MARLSYGPARHVLRTFWDSRGRGPAIQTALGGDIPPIHTWPETKKLGEIASGGSNSLVLLIKAKYWRYPNAIVYAVNATIATGQTKPKLGTQETHPIFRGTLDADVTFLDSLFHWHSRGARARRPAPESFS